MAAAINVERNRFPQAKLFQSRFQCVQMIILKERKGKFDSFNTTMVHVEESLFLQKQDFILKKETI